jgi:hypothetical protein
MMKRPRSFISTFLLLAILAVIGHGIAFNPTSADAGGLPRVADPRAGDPDEPDPGFRDPASQWTPPEPEFEVFVSRYSATTRIQNSSASTRLVSFWRYLILGKWR